MTRLTLGAMLLLTVTGLPVTAVGQRVDDVPLVDLVQILEVDGVLVAINARSGGQLEERLRLGERLLWKASRGGVGLALTDQRLLAVAERSGDWQRLDRGLYEDFPERALLGDRVALLVTSRRAIGFDGTTGNLLETSLGLRETVRDLRVGRNVAVVVTDRRASAMSAHVGGFFHVSLQLGEKLEAVEAEANLVSVSTQRRILIFRGPSGSWEIRLRDLD